MKRIALLLFLVMAVLLIYVFIQWDPKEQENQGKEESEDEVSIEDHFEPNLPRDVQRVELFERIERGGYDKNKETLLLQLAAGDDNVAYRSYVLLGDLSEEKKALSYYLRALEIHEEDRLWQRILDIVVKTGSEVEEELVLTAAEEQIRTPLGLQTYIQYKNDGDMILQTLAEHGLWEEIHVFLESNENDLKNVDEQTAAYYKVLSRIRTDREYNEILDQKLIQFPDDERLLFWKAQIMEEQGPLEEALEIYERIGARGAEKAGEIYLEMGEQEKAYLLFSESEHPPLMYRGARNLELIDRCELALPIYEKLIMMDHSLGNQSAYRVITLALDPEYKDVNTSYAKERLKDTISWNYRLGESPTIPIDEEIFDAPLEENEKVREQLDRLKALDHYGKTKSLQLEKGIINGQDDPYKRFALAKFYQHKSNHFLSVRQGIVLLRESKTLENYYLSYPKPYGNFVLKYAEKYGVDPYLIWAVMREESHFRSDAVSWAGAMGLMQIMPATGDWIAEQIGYQLGEGDLLRPEVNIEFGAFYLRNVLRIFDGDFDKALAAYNGGTGNVRRWKENRIGKSEAGFPVAIAFPETREYIVKVMDSYLTYLWIYEEGDFHGN